MTAGLVAFLRERLDHDQAEIEKDDRHWSGVPYEACSAKRLLAEVGAKRRVLSRHPGSTDEDECPGCGAHLDGTWRTEPGQLCPELVDLALPYAGHPDYRPEWAPES